MPSLDVGGIQEVADLLGTSRQWAYQLVERPGFPDPVKVLKTGRLWDLRAVMLWKDEGRKGES